MYKMISLVLLTASLSLGLSATSPIDYNHAGMRGKITKIRRASTEAEHRMVGMITVETEDETAEVDKANLIITDKTRILKEQHGKRVAVTFGELKIGQLAEAQFVDGPTIMIYPLQVAAEEIVILDAARNKMKLRAV